MSREAFELEAAKLDYLLDKHPINDDRYLFSETNDAYRIWQAAQQQVPEGYVAVPLEPTEAMLSVKVSPLLRLGNPKLPSVQEWRRHIYKAMLAASQEQPK